MSTAGSGERDSHRDSHRDIAISGNASPDEVAAVLAMLRELAARQPVVRPYERWRAQRIAALRACSPATHQT